MQPVAKRLDFPVPARRSDRTAGGPAFMPRRAAGGVEPRSRRSGPIAGGGPRPARHGSSAETASITFAINHMTMARSSFATLLRAADEASCAAVEVRTDLDGPLFDGMNVASAGVLARERGVRILALAEISAFNDLTADRIDATERLARTAAGCGAEAIVLVPRNDGRATSSASRARDLRFALAEIRPVLEAHGVKGLVEPLGFDTSSLRFKADAVEAIDSLAAEGTFRLIHDTFHHHLAAEDTCFASHTGIVHVSGVVSTRPAARLVDADRGLVDDDDRLGSVGQLDALVQGGYTGPVSIEAFAPSVHALSDPGAAVRGSFDHIAAALAALAA